MSILHREIVYPKGVVRLIDCFIYVSIDPSGGASALTATARTDKCGWTVVAVDKWDNRFILELKERHFTDEEFVEHVYQLHEQYLPRKIGIEKTPHLQSHFRHAEQQKKVVLPLIELTPRGRKKSVRIRSSSAALGRTYFDAATAPILQRLFRGWYDEMKHGDDGLDSFAYLDDFIEAPTEEQLVSHRAELVKLSDVLILSHLPPEAKEEWKILERFTPGWRESMDKDVEDFYNGN